MQALTNTEIEEFASRPKVRRIAVENFLMSMPLRIGEIGNLWNLRADATSYKWNVHTVKAISDGIRLAFSAR